MTYWPEDTRPHAAKPDGPNIVVTVLLARLVALRNQTTGARQRLAYARALVENETSLLTEYARDIELLRGAILAYGGVIPPEPPPENPVPLPEPIPGVGQED